MKYYIMKNLQALGIVFIIAILVPFQPLHAESFYSVSSLKILCGTDNSQNEFGCLLYLHGVVETWMLKDIVSTEPNRYSNRRNRAIFCDTINKVSDKEWLKIVRENLNSMESGFAASAVMELLSRKLCE